MYDIITIGSATQDVFLTSTDYQLIPSKKFSTGVGECFAFGSKIEVRDIFLDTGGGATNTAVTFRHLGFKTACLSRIGDDAPGREIRAVLKKEKVDTTLFITGKEHTAYSTILLTNIGERTVLVYRGASAHMQATEIAWTKCKTQWFYITSLGGNLALLRRIFSFAKKRNIAIAWNPGGNELEHGFHVLLPFLKAVKILIMNREEGARLVKRSDFQLAEILKGLCVSSATILALTDGRRGAYVRTGDEQCFAHATAHEPVNTTGAGDAFGSAFTASIMKGNDIADALRLGILNSGLVVTKMGAKNGLLEKMPSLKLLQKLPIKKLL